MLPATSQTALYFANIESGGSIIVTTTHATFGDNVFPLSAIGSANSVEVKATPSKGIMMIGAVIGLGLMGTHSTFLTILGGIIAFGGMFLAASLARSSGSTYGVALQDRLGQSGTVAFMSSNSASVQEIVDAINQALTYRY